MPEPVLAAYAEALRTVGNPASTHGHGQRASEVLEGARERLARALGCDRAELILTGGGTESINAALKGMFWAARRAGAAAGAERTVLLVAEGEHHATVEAAEWLRDEQGAELRWLPVDAEGRLHPETLALAISSAGAERVALASFLWANNEVGTVNDVAALCAVARTAGVATHVDAVSALGQIPVGFAASGADALSVSAHKVGGPVGVGALLLGRRAAAEALLHGGSQQRARSGTQDAAGAVAFAAALDLALDAAGRPDPVRVRRLARLRDRLIEGVRGIDPAAVLRGADPGSEGREPGSDGRDSGSEGREPGSAGRDPGAADAPGAAAQPVPQPARLPGNAHFTFPGCQGDSLVFLLDAAGISVSVGSACQAGVAEVSHVLLAMGVPEREAAGALRFTLGPETREADVDALLAALPGALERARAAGLA
ncbi:cysteine desulfurase NifS [Leucobacter massiliensis]|uniref:Cysteine desulfurase NifS n=2 Tax=Leucobacter massiliensis TaxID=1686285 RepID=A0A2S9QRP8_9MICO|nr:cysteine desulfurase NifS [Leucobacter massiliensis]